MKVENTSTTQKIKNRVNDIKEESQNQNNAPKEVRRGIGMSDEQKDFAKKIKQDIQNLYYKEGYSIRMIASHYNDLYSIRDKRGNIVKEAISRETIRKILNGEENVSLKTIIGNPYLLNF